MSYMYSYNFGLPQTATNYNTNYHFTPARKDLIECTRWCFKKNNHGQINNYNYLKQIWNGTFDSKTLPYRLQCICLKLLFFDLYNQSSLTALFTKCSSSRTASLLWTLKLIWFMQNFWPDTLNSYILIRLITCSSFHLWESYL